MLGEANLGRLLHDGDTGGTKATVTVLDYGFWQSRFGGDGSVVGKSLRTNDGDYLIVGIAEPSFRPVGEDKIQAYMPLVEKEFSGTTFNVLGRLKPGVRIEQARAEFELISKRMPRGEIEDSFTAQLVGLKEVWVRESRGLLWTLFAAALYAAVARSPRTRFPARTIGLVTHRGFARTG